MPTVKVLRDSKSGRFRGSVGRGKTGVPRSGATAAVSRLRYSSTGFPVSEEEYKSAKLAYYNNFLVEHPWCLDTPQSVAAADLEFVASNGFKEKIKLPLLKRVGNWITLREYKKARYGNVRQLEAAIGKADVNHAYYFWGALLNPNVSEDHLMVLGARVHYDQYVDYVIRHPAAGEKLLSYVVEANNTDNAEHRGMIAGRENLPVNLQMSLAVDSDITVREALMRNPSAVAEAKTLASLMPKGDDLFWDGWVGEYFYNFPVPDRLRKYMPNAPKFPKKFLTK